jgi:hypothetical protein
MQVGRVTVEILRPVPLQPLEVAARVARPGRSVELLEASLKLSCSSSTKAKSRACRCSTGVRQGTACAGVLLPASMVLPMAGLAFVCLTGFALVAGRLRTALARSRVSRTVNAAIGGLLVGLAAKLASAAR